MYPTIATIFEQTVKKYPNKQAIYYADKQIQYTYKEWDSEINKLSNALIKAGVMKGDRVSTYLFNTEELATTFFACAKIGAVFNPINFRLMAKEITFILKDAKPKIVIFEKTLAPQVESIIDSFSEISFWYVDDKRPDYAVDYHQMVNNSVADKPDRHVSEDDLYAIMYTSGTTGLPKGVMHNHRDVVEQSLIVNHATKLVDNDRGLVIAPMFHCAELHCAFFPRVHIGATNVICHHFDPKQVLQIIEDQQITVLFAAPTMWNILIQEELSRYNLKSLRLGLYGAAPMAPALVRDCHDHLGIKLVQAYGMTEMGPAITFLMEDEQMTKAGSAGKACLSHDIRVVKPNEHGPSNPDDILPSGEVGEVIVQGPCMMAGYFQREEATEKALYKGWYHSGDIGYFDEDGYLWIADRVDDMIISGGENIYPREVEDVLYEHPGVLDVAVIGIPDGKWGESVMAYIVKKDPDLTEDALEKLCKESKNLANYKRPRYYHFVDQLPRNASGKIQKFVLRSKQQESETDV